MGNGKWRLDYRDAASRRRRVTFNARTRADAETERARIIARRTAELTGEPCEDLQSQRLSEATAPYIRHLRATNARPESIRSARGAIDRVIEAIGDRPVRAVTPAVITKFREDRLNGDGFNKKAAPTTVNLQVTLLNAALNHAVDLKLLARNPIADVKKLPEPEDARVMVRRAMKEDEVERFLEAIQESDRKLHRLAIPQEALWRLFVDRGPRWSETAALCWSAVDLQKARVKFRSPTTKGRRTRVVPIPALLVDALTELRKRQSLHLGRPVREIDVVFRCPTGEPWADRSDSVRLRVLREHLRAARIEPDPVDGRGRIDVHALRMTAATRLLREGMSAVAVSKITGHRDLATLLKHYEDIDIQDVEAELDRIENPKRKSEPKKRGKDRA